LPEYESEELVEMKIAFSLYKYFPFGGLQRDFLRIARECRDRGHEIHVYTMAWSGEQEPGFHLHLVKPRGFTNHGRSKSFINQLQQQLKEHQPDLVMGFNKMPGLDLYYAADVCYKARVANRSMLYKRLPRYSQWVRQEEAVFTAGKPTQIMLIAPAQQEAFSRCYQTESERFHLLPPGIAKDRIASANAQETAVHTRQQLQVGDNELMLLMIGSGFKTKGVDRAILAFASLTKTEQARTHLFVVGADNPKIFTALARKHSVADRIHFLGGRLDVPELLLAADALLHPAYYDNTATVLLEAVVAGLPVLTTDQCGYAHYIEKANAGIVLTAPFEQAKFNQALADMLAAKEKRAQWQQQALAFAKQADIYSMPQRAADLIEETGRQRAILSSS
jgi:UDP-glucose:(heptosyl)LPS alpha-1,3-glucosyltransferase